MSLERRYVDILTMGRSGIDIFPLQVGAHLEDVETFGKFLGGSRRTSPSQLPASGIAPASSPAWGTTPSAAS